MELTTKIKEFFGYKGEQPPAYTDLMYRSNPYQLSPWVWTPPTTVDYSSEVGRLNDSSLIMAIVNWTGTQLPEAPPVVKKPGKDNALEIEWGNPAADVLRRPNRHYIWADYCGAIALSWWIDGNVYFYKVRDEAGNVIELWYLPHFLVEPRWPGDGRSPEVPPDSEDKFLSHYQYSVGKLPPVLYEANDILHIKRFVDVNDPRRGIGAFGPITTDVVTDNAAAAFSATVMRNMGMVPYLLAPKEQTTISETQANAIKDNWLQRTRGANIGLPLVNAIPLEVTKLGLNPTEMDLSKIRMSAESRAAAVSNIPAALLQYWVGLENGTSFAAYKEARQQGYESVIIPIQAAIAEHLTWQLLYEFDKTKGAKYDFDVSQVRVLQEDRDALYKRATLALTSGGISRNQFAASLSKPPPDKEEIYYVPSTVTPMTQELIEETAKEKAAPPVPVDPTITNALSKAVDMDRYLSSLEKQMENFTP